jgi:hypothetical protein
MLAVVALKARLAVPVAAVLAVAARGQSILAVAAAVIKAELAEPVAPGLSLSVMTLLPCKEKTWHILQK